MASATQRWFRVAYVGLALSSAPRMVLAEPRPYHPDPRVIVNVTSARGPHARKELERAARLAWGRIVSCYEATAGGAKGIVEFELVVAGTGKVTEARRTRSTFRNEKLEGCLSRALTGVTMPQARARSIAQAQIHLAPGDP